MFYLPVPEDDSQQHVVQGLLEVNTEAYSYIMCTVLPAASGVLTKSLLASTLIGFAKLTKIQKIPREKNWIDVSTSSPPPLSKLFLETHTDMDRTLKS